MQTPIKLMSVMCLPAYSLHYAVFKVLLLKIHPAVWQLDAQLLNFSIRLLYMVEVSGLEPLTSCLQSRRSTN
jgi:hypothetical protein